MKKLIRLKACFVFVVTSFVAIGIGAFAFAQTSGLQPRQGGTLIYGRGADSVALDPALGTDGESLIVSVNVCEGLVKFKTGTTEIMPGLAERWTVTPDHLEYVFYLRKNVVFHDGTPFNADAVVFSFMRQKDPKHEAYKWGTPAWSFWNDMGFQSLIKSVEKENDFVVKIKLNHPEASFLASMSMVFASIVSPTAVLKYKEQFNKKPVCTGPFQFDSWKRGETVTLKANRAYWGQKPYLDKVIFRSITDSATRLNSFLSKSIHLMSMPSPDQIRAVRNRRPDAKLLEGIGMNMGYLAINVTKLPFESKKVRQAMAMAIDKEAIVKGIYAGYGIVAKNPLPPFMLGHHDKIVQWPYDLNRARALLAEAGFSNGFEAEMYILPVSRPYMPDPKKVGEAIQADLAKIGVKLKLNTVEWATYLNQLKNGRLQLALYGWNGDNGDPDNFLFVLFSGENAVAPASNVSFYKNPVLDKILRDAKVQSSPAKRVELYKKAQEIINEDVPAIPLAHSKEMMPADPKVQNMVLNPTAIHDFVGVWLQQ